MRTSYATTGYIALTFD